MNEALYYNALAVAVTGDRRKLVKLLKKYGGFERAYKKLRDGTLLGGGAARAAMPDAGAEWKKLGERSVRLIFAGEKGYPPLLAEIEDRPFGIYILGTFPRGDTAPCAIVGTRRATPEGKSIAHRFAHNLAQAGFPIVSGLAFGIDAAAHEGCLDARGTTVAVLAGGLDDVYPRENGRLAKRILESGGAIISEYPLGAPPYPDRFLERNRIISGLRAATLIVEAPVGSGALVTARLALEQNRDVFVVPGPITQPQLRGRAPANPSRGGARYGARRDFRGVRRHGREKNRIARCRRVGRRKADSRSACRRLEGRRMLTKSPRPLNLNPES